MSDYRSARKELAEKMGGSQGCRVCGSHSPSETLSNCGGMCFPCFQRYCRERPPVLQRSNAAEKIRAEIAAMGKKLPL